MSTFGLIKAVARLASSAVVSTVISNAVKMNTPKNINNLQKVLVGLGGFVLSSFVADQTDKYVEDVLNKFAKKAKV